MSLKSDKWIRRQYETDNPTISSFVSESIKTNTQGNRIPSYGITSFGYDIRNVS